MAIHFDEQFITTHKRPAKRDKKGNLLPRHEQTAILFFHRMENGKPQWQGYLYELRGDGTGTAQLFEWFMGTCTDEIAITKAFLTECVFYSTAYEMNRAYDDFESTEGDEE